MHCVQHLLFPLSYPPTPIHSAHPRFPRWDLVLARHAQIPPRPRPYEQNFLRRGQMGILLIKSIAFLA